jgi:hypothetical protein
MKPYEPLFNLFFLLFKLFHLHIYEYLWFYPKLRFLGWNIDYLIDYLRFYVPLKNISLIWIRHHCRWRAAKFRPMLGAQGLWAGRDLYRATPAVTRDLGFSGLIRRTAPFNRLLRHTRVCGGSILTRILTGVKHWNTPGIHHEGMCVSVSRVFNHLI